MISLFNGSGKPGSDALLETCSMKNDEYEKLGVFYLGKNYDLEQRKTGAELVLYESKDLTTHAVCVGMTGSGKTGLCLALLEEAAIDGIPVIAIDPKGDLGNLLLTFPELRGADFAPWVDPDEAARQGASRRAVCREDGRDLAQGTGSLGPGRSADPAVSRGRRPGHLHAGQQRGAAADGPPLVRRARRRP